MRADVVVDNCVIGTVHEAGTAKVAAAVSTARAALEGGWSMVSCRRQRRAAVNLGLGGKSAAVVFTDFSTARSCAASASSGRQGIGHRPRGRPTARKGLFR